MEIYVVMSGEWKDREVEKVYLSEQKAQEYCQERNLLLLEDDPDRCHIVTWETDDDKPILKTKWAQVMSYDCETIDFIDPSNGPRELQKNSEKVLTFTIDVSTCKNYEEVMELAEKTLEQHKKAGEF